MLTRYKDYGSSDCTEELVRLLLFLLFDVFFFIIMYVHVLTFALCFIDPLFSVRLFCFDDFKYSSTTIILRFIILYICNSMCCIDKFILVIVHLCTSLE